MDHEPFPDDHARDARIGRRPLAAGLLTSFLLGGVRVAMAEGAPGDRKFVLIVLRGALDGIAAVPPLGDPDHALVRGSLALPVAGEGAALPLDARFGLHPAMPFLHRMYGAGEALVLHAVASPYRQRSHFDGQAMLELGTARLGGADGWLNRALVAMGSSSPPAMAVGASIPLVLLGQRTVTNWQFGQAAPGGLGGLAANVARMYEKTPLLGPALAEGLQTAGLVGTVLGQGRVGNAFSDVCAAVGHLMAAPGGPGVMVVELGGWDTHVGQGAANGRLASNLRTLDRGLEALQLGLGEHWRETVVCAVTEFGRTARVNGTGGTDHGTATAAFVAGGAVHGGRVVAQWPGLAPGALFENRDLAPTTDLRRLFKGVLADHLKLPTSRLATVFPDSTGATPLQGLIRT